ncbi:MAG TPA: serine hydrolase domain-containing protein [Acidimicrobiales bacterium]|nr:serine hydrolase domain-containing protein [Acidimicrobiales bacterium]
MFRGNAGGRFVALGMAVILVSSCGSSGATAARKAADADTALDAAIKQIVTAEGGPPGIAVVVQRGSRVEFHAAGIAVVGGGTAPQINDHMRLASVAKAFSGAAALALVADRVLSLNDTVSKWRPDLPRAWAEVTLAQLLGHTSGIPDFSQTEAFQAALGASLLSPPPPVKLLSFVADQPLEFTPGVRYAYSNTDNIVVALIIEAATHRPYEAVLEQRVLQPLGLPDTSLPTDATMPSPFMHGYQAQASGPPEDVSELFAAGWTFASGGVVSTPGDANRFIRGYVKGATTNKATRTAQFHFIQGGNSEPPGPGTNAAGLAIFQYQTGCGTVYGHTGNTPGYTQFVAATSDGSRSVSVAVNAQINANGGQNQFPALRNIFGLAVCAALAGT